MESMDYLHILESHGFQAYLVGGFVRDRILGRSTTDLDIATDASPEDVRKIFDLSLKDNYGSLKFAKDGFTVDITTFREEAEYLNRRPTRISFIGDIETDSLRRDFTINAIYMDSKEKYFDFHGGLKDLNDKIIRSIGDADIKFIEDPLRMLRAIRFSTVYDFSIENRTFKSICKNKEHLTEISYERKKEELTQILLSKNADKGLRLLKECGMSNYLDITYDEKYHQTTDFLGAWAQLNFSSNYPFTRKEREKIESISFILKEKSIDREILYKYGLENALVAGKILGYKEREIKTIYDEMPIHADKDIKITNEEIISVIDSSKVLKMKQIKNDLIQKILSGNLSNESNTLKKYIRQKWSE